MTKFSLILGLFALCVIASAWWVAVIEVARWLIGA